MRIYALTHSFTHRTACDHCALKKIRCSGFIGFGAPCEQCRKNGALCHFSPRKPTGPRASTPAVRTASLSNSNSNSSSTGSLSAATHTRHGSHSSSRSSLSLDSFELVIPPIPGVNSHSGITGYLDTSKLDHRNSTAKIWQHRSASPREGQRAR